MITKEVIEQIYRSYKSRPRSVDELRISSLYDKSLEKQKIHLEEGDLVIGSLPADTPFRTIPLDRIHAIVEFDRHVAIVMHSSILFLRRDSDKVDVHLKLKGPSLLDRLKMKF